MGLDESNLKAAPAHSASSAKIEQYRQQQQQHETSSTTSATSCSNSSSSGNSVGDSSDEQQQQQATHRLTGRSSKPNTTCLQTAQRSVSTKRPTATALVISPESEDEALPGDEAKDGIHRVTWNDFLRFPARPRKTKMPEENGTVGNRKGVKRMLPESGERNENNHDTKELNPLDAEPNAKKIKMTWKGRFEQLREYYQEHGTTRVPQVYETDQSFSHWVVHQRRKYTRKQRGDDPEALSDSRFVLLKSLGFEALKRAGEQRQKQQQRHHEGIQQQQQQNSPDRSQQQQPLAGGADSPNKMNPQAATFAPSYVPACKFHSHRIAVTPFPFF